MSDAPSTPPPPPPTGTIARLPFTLDRVPFLVAGLGLFAIKFVIDATIARTGFGREWSPWDYLVTSVPITAVTNMSGDMAFHLTLLGVAVPFIAAGVALTLARLRGAGMPPWLVVLFFPPVVNLLFFVVLATVPGVATAKATRARRGPDPTGYGNGAAGDDDDDALAGVPPASPAVLGYGRDAPPASGFRGWLPEGATASLWVAALLPVPFGLLLTYAAVYLFRDYGLGAFVALPFTQGLLAASLHGARRRRRMAQSLGAAVLCGLLTMVATFTMAVEGLGCLVMLLPLALPVAMLGGAAGHALQAGAAAAGPGARAEWGRVYLSLRLAVPAFMASEDAARPAAPAYAVTTSVEVDAPPGEVWRHVIAFGRIAPPSRDDWLFRFGVAYPVEATIDGTGPGAVRHCVFSTGPFVEPITVWDEPRLLKFDVTSNPPAMREWSVYDDVHPPHVDDFLVSHGGEFRLVPLDGGRRTRLEGTTWYEHNLWPAGYWRLWSDLIIHRIHGRVLGHVKRLAEAERVRSENGS